jgi:hypothetical protein
MPGSALLLLLVLEGTQYGEAVTQGLPRNAHGGGQVRVQAVRQAKGFSKVFIRRKHRPSSVLYMTPWIWPCLAALTAHYTTLGACSSLPSGHDACHMCHVSDPK